MIIQFNPIKLTRQVFFGELLIYLEAHSNPTLREIKKSFPDVKHLDRSIEEYIKAGLIRRENKRYQLSLPILDSVENLDLDCHIFVDSESDVYSDLLNLFFETCLTNTTNAVKIVEGTDFAREELTLSNYFYKLGHYLPLSDQQERLYQLLGDVNPEYFLKHATTFLLKFVRKDEFPQKRRNIFVDALELLGYIEQVSEGRYVLAMDMDVELLTFTAKKTR